MQTQHIAAKNLLAGTPDERKPPKATFPIRRANSSVGRQILDPAPEQAAWEILQAAEDTDCLMSMAGDRAACGNFLPPVTPASFLFWFEDEAEIQEAQADTYPDEAPKRLQYAAALRKVADRLRDLGYEPSLPEKEIPIVQPHPLTEVEPAVLPISRLKQAALDFTPAGG